MNKFGIKTTLILASSLTVMSGALIAPALPKIAKAFHEIPNISFYTKLLLTVPAFFIAIASPFAGLIIDRLGKIKPMLWATFLYALAGSAGLYLSGLPEILAGRAVLGLMVALIMTTATTLIGDYFEGKERTDFLGLQGAFMAFGGTIFISLSGILADFNWRYPFGVYLSSLIVLVLGFIYLFEPEKGISRSDSSSHNNSANWKFYFTIYIASFFGMLLFYLVPTQLPFLMQAIGITSSAKGSIGLIVVTLTAAISSANYSKIAHRFNFKQIYTLLFLLAGAGLGLTYFVNSLLGASITMALAGVGFGLLMPNASLCLISAAPHAIRGKVIGGLTSALFLGQFFSPLLFEPIVSNLGIKTAYLVGAIMSSLISLFFFTRKEV